MSHGLSKRGGICVIAGLQKMTLLDFPGKVACTVFLGGCNFRCPFCHNAELFGRAVEPVMSHTEFLRFLESRKGLLEGVCVSGGEPTLDPELPELLRGIKALGYAVKLDTNGSRPAVLKHLVAEKLVDYVAMDVKNSPARYAATVGLERLDLTPIEESLRFLLTDTVPYELRTTLVQQLHDGPQLEEMGKWLCDLAKPGKVGKLYLQSFVDRETVVFEGLTAPSEAEVSAWRERLRPYAGDVIIRGR